MTSSDSSDEGYNGRLRSPSPNFGNRRSKSSPDRHRSQSHRRRNYDDYRKKHHKTFTGASTSRGNTLDGGHDLERGRDRESGRDDERHRYQRDDERHRYQRDDERHRYQRDDERHCYQRDDEHDRYRRDDYKKDPKSSRGSSPQKCFSADKTYLERGVVLKPKKEGDVIESMENAFTDGPLEVLKHCVHDGQKVMVWVRSQRGIRGICTGFVLAFDKFWNLIMQDVDEVYHKNLNPRTPFLLSDKVGKGLPEKSKKKKKKKTEKLKTEPTVLFPEEIRLEIRERRKQRKEEEKKQRLAERSHVSRRNMSKTFVRGDNVVFVKICE